MIFCRILETNFGSAQPSVPLLVSWAAGVVVAASCAVARTDDAVNSRREEKVRIAV